MKARYVSLKPLVHWGGAERPIDWRRAFGRRGAPLEVEIGFGNGAFLVRRARAHPERNFLGIDLEWPSTRRALRKIARASLSNVRLVQADARLAFERLLLPRSLRRAYSLFPSPWPKERNVKERLFSHAFLRLLNSRLEPGGEAQVVTDHRPYLDWVAEQLPGTGFEASWQAVPARFDTKYERKWQDGGQEHFYELRLIKRTHCQVPLKEDAKLKTYRVPHFDPDRFQPAGERGELIVEFKEFLYDPRRQKGMARAFVAEEGLKQEIWIQIVRREQDWHIGLARGCGFLPTVGVQRALDLARDAVHPGDNLFIARQEA
jgi:tRNA (guanine-N7-)-methyltransferase